MNIRYSKRLAIATAVLGSLAIVSAAVAADPVPTTGPGGSFVFKNNTTKTLRKGWETSIGLTNKNLPTALLPSATTNGSVYAPVGAKGYSTTFNYQDPNTGEGCYVAVSAQFYPSANRWYTYITSGRITKTNGPVKCSVTYTNNRSTGDFVAYPVISGF